MSWEMRAIQANQQMLQCGFPVIDVFRAKHPTIIVPDINNKDQAQAFSDYLLINDPIPIFCYEDYLCCQDSSEDQWCCWSVWS
mmetsp:Transcript_1537/g.2792  ORF Transcript_1537/g.2792 Transcript_1537/m.2792 type:complete len:83 (+) Transcript_1537:72-320(+)